MKKLALILLLVAGACNAGFLAYQEIDSFGDNSELWDRFFQSSDDMILRGVIDGEDGYVTVGEAIFSSDTATYSFSVDVLNMDSNDSFDYEMLALVGGSVYATSGVTTLAPGASTTLELVDTVANFNDVGMMYGGVKIAGGNDIFLTKLSDLVVPEPVTVATVALGGLLILNRRKFTK